MTATVAGIHLGPDTHANRPAAATPPVGSLYSCTDHSLVYRTDGSSWNTYASAITGSGSVASDAIWDAAGDLAVGSGADTAAKLSIGAAGATLGRINGAVAWNAGTSFPTAAAGDRYWRTDRNILYFYDGTRWLSVNLFREPVGVLTTAVGTSGTVFGRLATWHSTYDMWLDTMYIATFITTTNDGTKFWTFDLKKYQSDGATNSIVATRNTSADTASTIVTAAVAIGAALTPATYKLLQLEGTKTSTPGNASIAAASLAYRLIG